MPSFLRNVLAMVAAVAMGVAIVMLGDQLSNRIHPAPAGLNVRDAAQVQAYVTSIPLGLKAGMVFYWALAVFAAAFTGKRFGKQDFTGWAPAVLLAVMIAMNLVMLPHPIWMKLAAGVAAAAAAYGGVKAGGLTDPKKPNTP